MNVRFEGNNGHDADVTRCLLLTHSGHTARAERLPDSVRSIHGETNNAQTRSSF